MKAVPWLFTTLIACCGQVTYSDDYFTQLLSYMIHEDTITVDDVYDYIQTYNTSSLNLTYFLAHRGIGRLASTLDVSGKDILKPHTNMTAFVNNVTTVYEPKCLGGGNHNTKWTHSKVLTIGVALLPGENIPLHIQTCVYTALTTAMDILTNRTKQKYIVGTSGGNYTDIKVTLALAKHNTWYGEPCISPFEGVDTLAHVLYETNEIHVNMEASWACLGASANTQKPELADVLLDELQHLYAIGQSIEQYSLVYPGYRPSRSLTTKNRTQLANISRLYSHDMNDTLRMGGSNLSYACALVLLLFLTSGGFVVSTNLCGAPPDTTYSTSVHPHELEELNSVRDMEI